MAFGTNPASVLDSVDVVAKLPVLGSIVTSMDQPLLKLTLRVSELTQFAIELQPWETNVSHLMQNVELLTNTKVQTQKLYLKDKQLCRFKQDVTQSSDSDNAVAIPMQETTL